MATIRYECDICGNGCDVLWSLFPASEGRLREYSCIPCHRLAAEYRRTQANVVPPLSWVGAVGHMKKLSRESRAILKEGRAHSLRTCVVMLAGLPHNRSPVP